MNLPPFSSFIAAGLCLMEWRSGLNAETLQPLSNTLPGLRDPFVISDSKKYFLFGGANDGVQCYESPDLVNWKNDGCAWRVSGLTVAKGDLHAQHVFSYRGMFYLVYTARMPGASNLGLASSTQPQGPYHDVHVPWLSIGQSVVGPSVFVDHNGKAYLTYIRSTGKENWIYGAALSPDLAGYVSPPVKLLQSQQRTELDRNKTGSFFYGACIFRIGSKFYLSYSLGGAEGVRCSIGYATADKPLGPWTIGENSSLVSSGSVQGGLSAGHVSVFRAIDRKSWLLAYENAEPVPSESLVGKIHFENLALDGIRRLVTKPLVSERR